MFVYTYTMTLGMKIKEHMHDRFGEVEYKGLGD